MSAEDPVKDQQAQLTTASAPVLTCEQARDLEAALFAGIEDREWTAMQQAGRAIAAGVVEDFEEIGGFAPAGRILVLVGKGHNGGDALIAAAQLLARFPAASADVVFAFGDRALRPLTARAWREGSMAALRDRCRAIPQDSLRNDYDLCLDGVFGFQFRPPATPDVAGLIERVNAIPIRLRAAVDLPSAGLFRADFTYATGSLKRPVLEAADGGRIRYLDLGFFTNGVTPHRAIADRVLTTRLLEPLRRLRPTASDKRTFGHLFVVGGSRSYPGAVLMATLAAVRSGAGLVTAFVPESLVPAYAARLPEAMWVGWPETPVGGLALEGLHLFRERLERANAVLLGPGLAREAETLALARELVGVAGVPVVLDADALQTDVVRAARAPLVVTPHAGEFARIAGGQELPAFAAATGATVVLKGTVTRIASGAGSVVYHSLFGGPVLARGGSGDVLSGIIGSLLAQRPTEPLVAAARGVVWHGCAADLLARAHGQVAVATTQLLEYLGPALRST